MRGRGRAAPIASESDGAELDVPLVVRPGGCPIARPPRRGGPRIGRPSLPLRSRAFRWPALALAIAVLAADARADGALQRVDASAVADLEWAVGTHDGESQKLQLRVEPSLRVDLPHGFQLGAIGRLRADAFDHLEPGRPDQPEVAPMTRRLGFGDRVDAELRELYVQGEVSSTWLRIGKQQVVWGQADGLKVLDIVDPQSFDEFILPDFQDSRIPLWTVNAEVPIRHAHLQLLWIPDPTEHDLPPRDGVFAFTAPRLVGPRPPPGVAVDVASAHHPSVSLGHSDVGARLSGFWHGFDLSANALWHWDDVPIPFRSVDLSGPAPLVHVEPGFRRTAVFGGTLSNAFGNLTVRGELAAQLSHYLPTSDPADSNGVVGSPDLQYVIGLDWYGFRDTLISGQLFQSCLVHHPDGVIRDRVDTNVTLLVRRQLRHETLTLQAIWIHDLNQGDGLVRPRVTYAVRDNLQVWLGFDVFYGTRKGIYGEFDAADRLVVGVERGF